MRNPQNNLRRLLQKMEARYGSDDVHVQQLRDELNAMSADAQTEPAPAPGPSNEMPQINFHFETTRKPVTVRAAPVRGETFPPITWPQWHETAWPAPMK